MGGCALSAPSLSACAHEVLRALFYGLELRRISGTWRFDGPRQNPRTSEVALDAIVELWERGFVFSDGIRTQITEEGSKYLDSWEDEAFEWLIGSELRLKL